MLRVLWTHHGKQKAGWSPCCKGQHFLSVLFFFFRLHYFWICCLDNMSDCFCFWLRSPLKVSCPRFVLQMFTTFVVLNRTPIVNLDFSTGTVQFTIFSLSSAKQLLQRQTHNSFQGYNLFSKSVITDLNTASMFVGYGSDECMWCGRDNSDQRCRLSNQVKKNHI